MKDTTTQWLGCLLVATAIGVATATAADKADAVSRPPLSRPDDQAPDQTKKVKVRLGWAMADLLEVKP